LQVFHDYFHKGVTLDFLLGVVYDVAVLGEFCVYLSLDELSVLVIFPLLQ